MSTMYICHGVQKNYKCRFEGACYGEICIAPSICSKKRVINKKDIRFIIKFLKMQLKEQKGFTNWIKEWKEIQKKNIASNIKHLNRKIKYYQNRLT